MGSDSLGVEQVPTIELEEGPFYKNGSSERNMIAEPGTPGKKLILEGRVLTRALKPVEHAWVDFWQANGNGIYDNEGYNLRGHQYTDASGHFYLETVRPVEYQSRTAHVHVKVQAPDSPEIFTTQLFLPGEKRNSTDRIFDPSLVMKLSESDEYDKAEFDIVLDID